MAEHPARGEQEDVDTELGIRHAQIREEWDWVKAGIEEILFEQAQLTFRPEDVYAACLNEEAHLWVAPEGFVISTSELDPFTGARTFLLWLAWAKKRDRAAQLSTCPFLNRLLKKVVSKI